MLDDVKQFLRIDGTDEDAQIVALIDAAETYLTNAGVTKDESNELYKLAVEMLVTNWYENREPIGQANEIAFGLRNIITQLKYCQTVTP